MTAKELLLRAHEAAGAGVGGPAGSIPLAMGRERVVVAVFFFRVDGTARAYSVYPPKFLVRLDLETGAVISKGAIVPSQIGPDAPIDEPLPRHPNERRLEDPDAFWEHYHELLATFHEAFQLYAEARPRLRPELQARVSRCNALFHEVAEKRLLPWYEGLGAPFLEWMRRFS